MKRLGDHHRGRRRAAGVFAAALVLSLAAWWTLGRGAATELPSESLQSPVAMRRDVARVTDASPIAGTAPSSSGAVEALPAVTTPRLDARLAAFPLASCRGRVVDEHGKALAGATVWCVPDASVLESLGFAEEAGLAPIWWMPSGPLSAGRIDLDAMPTATTDAEGRFELRVPFAATQPPVSSRRAAREDPELLVFRDGSVPARRVCRELGPAGCDVGDITLPSAAIVAGRTVDEHGQGVGEVDVQVGIEGHELPVAGDPPQMRNLDPGLRFRFARTGADGRFRMACLWPGTAAFSFDAAARLAARRVAVALAAGSELDLGDIVLERGPSISGRVIDIGGGALAGAEVRVSIHDFEGARIEHPIHAELDVVRSGRLAHTGVIGEREGRYGITRTDADGRFTLGGLSQAEYGVYAAADGWEPERLLHVATGSEGVVLSLRPQGKLRLRLVDATTAAPLADAVVRIVRGSGKWFPDDVASLPVRNEAAAGAGAFVVEQVCIAPMAAVIESQSHGRQILRFDGLPLGAPIEDRELRVPLGALLSGSVVNEAGAGLAGAQVRLLPYDNDEGLGQLSDGMTAMTGADGGFQFAGVTPAHWSLHAFLGGFGGLNQTDFVLAPGEKREGMVVRLEGLGHIEGRVLKPDATPAGDVMVAAMKDVAKALAEAVSTTDADGRFALNVHPGTYAVEVNAAQPTHAVREAVAVAGGETVHVDISLPTPASLSGRVIANKEPVANAMVHVSGARLSLDARTNAEGEYRLDLPTVSGECFLWARSPRGGLTEKQPFVVTAGQALVVDLELGALTLGGVIVDAAAGTPVVGARVSFAVRDGGGSEAPVLSDAEGRFAIHDVSPGHWLCLASHERYLNTPWIPVEIDAAGQASVVRIEMTRGGVLTGTVRTQGGMPSTREWCVGAWLDGETAYRPYDTTTKNGAWELVGLAPGHYTVLLTRVLEPWEDLEREGYERIAKARAGMDVAAGQEVVLALRLDAGEK